jgi:hypothetical protein
MLEEIQMFVFWRILRLTKLIFLKKVITVLVDNGQAVCGPHGRSAFLKRSNSKSILDLFAAEKRSQQTYFSWKDLKPIPNRFRTCKSADLFVFGKMLIQLQLDFGLVNYRKSSRVVHKLYKYSLKFSKTNTNFDRGIRG